MKPEDLVRGRQVMEALAAQPLRKAAYFLSEQEYEDIMGGKLCGRCGGHYPLSDACHAPHDCDLEWARQVMDS